MSNGRDCRSGDFLDFITLVKGDIEQGEFGALQQLVDLARVDLAQRLDVELEAVTVVSVQETEFEDASLGVPEPGKAYAQVLTPGHVIQLRAEGVTYDYHASAERLVFASGEEQAPQGGITIEGVQVVAGAHLAVGAESRLAFCPGLLLDRWQFPGDGCWAILPV
jgi:hypothetical protein